MLSSALLSVCRFATDRSGHAWRVAFDRRLLVRHKSRGKRQPPRFTRTDSAPAEALKQAQTSDTITLYDSPSGSTRFFSSLVAASTLMLAAGAMTVACGYERLKRERGRERTEREKAQRAKEKRLKSMSTEASQSESNNSASNKEKVGRKVNTKDADAVRKPDSERSGVSDGYSVSTRPPKVFQELKKQEKVPVAEKGMFSWDCWDDVFPPLEDLAPSLKRGMKLDCSSSLLLALLLGAYFIVGEGRRVKTVRYCNKTKQVLLFRHMKLSRAPDREDAGRLVQVMPPGNRPSGEQRLNFVCVSFFFITISGNSNGKFEPTTTLAS